MKTRSGMWTMTLFGLSALLLSARADEEKVPLEKVPAAVLKAVREKFPKAELQQAEKEDEDGATIYEIGLTQDGRHVDVSLKEDGTIVEVEKAIAAQDLPRAVADAIRAKYPNGAIKKAEEVSEREQEKFEVVVAEGNKMHEVVLDRAGKVLEDEEGDED